MAKNKKKKASVSGAPKAPRRPGSVWKKVCISICIVALILVGVGYCVVWSQDQKTIEADANFVREQETSKSVVCQHIDSALSSKSGSAKIYDASDKLLFILRGSTGDIGSKELPEKFITDLQLKLLSSGTPAKIDLDAWTKSHTVLGGLVEKRTMEDLRQGSLGYLATEYFCSSSQTMLSEETKFVVAAYLDKQYTAADLVSYCAAVGKFGSIAGVVNASEQLFNKDVSKLNGYQLAYLVYAFDVPDASWEEFFETNSGATGGAQTAEEFGLVQAGSDSLWLLKREVKSELENILGSRLESEEFHVKLGLDGGLQEQLQQQLDSEMKTSITLGADNQTVLDGTIGVVDAHTGFVKALIGGRSVNTVSRELSLGCTSMIGNYEAVGSEMLMNPNLTYASLMTIETAEGTVDYAPLAEVVYNDQLGAIGISPVVQSSCKLDEVLDFGASLYIDSGIRYIQQVKDASTDEVIYMAKAANDVSGVAPNPDLRVLLNADSQGTSVMYTQDCTTGSVVGVFNSEYIFGMVAGTMTDGYSMTFDDYDICATAALNISRFVSSYYPKTPEPIDTNGVVESKLSKALAGNTQVVKEAVESWIQELKDAPITSVGTRSNWENMYAQYSNQLYNYAGLIPSDLLQTLHEQMDAVRIDRYEELLKFVA